MIDSNTSEVPSFRVIEKGLQVLNQNVEAQLVLEAKLDQLWLLWHEHRTFQIQQMRDRISVLEKRIANWMGSVGGMPRLSLVAPPQAVCSRRIMGSE